jgi:hypothetical protein
MGTLSIAEMAEIIAPGSPTLELGVRSLEKQHEDLVHPDEAVATETPTHYILHAGRTGSGVSYRSNEARRLSSIEFLAMLRDA